VATFVLIPGAGTDPRVYDATIEALGALGHGGLAPALPLDDPDAAPSDHADAVVRALPADAEVIVVAQSLGAFAAPLVAAGAPVAQLVLVAPMIPGPERRPANGGRARATRRRSPTCSSGSGR
jgi:alpha-beta hydrolase superfamily lysophospholipase